MELLPSFHQGDDCYYLKRCSITIIFGTSIKWTFCAILSTIDTARVESQSGVIIIVIIFVAPLTPLPPLDYLVRNHFQTEAPQTAHEPPWRGHGMFLQSCIVAFWNSPHPCSDEKCKKKKKKKKRLPDLNLSFVFTKPRGFSGCQVTTYHCSFL